MAVTLTTAARNAQCDATVDLLDTGSGDATGDLAFCNASVTVLCVCNFSNPAFGSSSSGVATAAAIAQGTAAATANPSTLTIALLRNRANTEQLRCAVGTSGSDINLTNTSINDGDTIDISSLTYTVPAT